MAANVLRMVGGSRYAGGRATAARGSTPARRPGALVLPLATALLWLFSCGIFDSGLEVDGYARLEGTVTRASGAAYANGTVRVSCPPAIQDLRGETDARGSYGFLLLLPSPLGESLSPQGTLACRISAPELSASAEAEVRFWPREEEIVPVVVNLREGAGR